MYLRSATDGLLKFTGLFTYQANRPTYLMRSETYIRVLFIDISSAFNLIDKLPLLNAHPAMFH